MLQNLCGIGQGINNKAIQENYKIQVLVAEACGYVVQLRTNQDVKKEKRQVASSTKWGLGENVVLRLMECLTPTVCVDIFMDNYFTFFSTAYPPWS